MTTVTLYDDQTELVGRVTDTMRREKNVLIQAATGFGKTRLAAHMIDRARLKGSRAGMVVPRRELLKQTSNTLREFRIPHGIVAARFKPDPFKSIQLMTGGTLSRRLDKAPKLDVVFFDEAHFGGAELDRIIKHYQAMGAWVLGLSATPLKMNGKGMCEWYGAMVKGPSIRWLMDAGRLSDYRLFAPNIPDLSALRTSNGDYVKKDVDDFMGSDEIGKVLVGNAAAHYNKNSYGKLNLSFCSSVKNAEMTAQKFRDAGIPSMAVSGDTPDDELRRIIRAYANREILNITCAQLLEFGFDLEQASGVNVTIETMSDLSPTKSLPRQMQRWGRVLRAKEYPAIINDHVGNSIVHGLPDSDREWSLDGKKNRGKLNDEKTEPTRQCPECYFVFRPEPACPCCGYVFPVMERKIDEVDGELQEVTEGRMMTPKQEIGMIARTGGLQGLIDYGKEKGYKPGWARKQAQIRGMV